jgi:hypothetical protein
MTDEVDVLELMMMDARDLLNSVPETCQQFGCRAPVQTWCVLCRAFFCDAHDQLTPVRRHDCLRGPAEVI